MGHEQGAHRSKIFFTCILRFFSSALIDAAVGPGADVDPTGACAVLLVRARLAGGC